MKFPSYPKYKDSGVEWLGEVPEHWDISRFSRFVHIAEGQVNPEIEPYSEMILIAPNHIESGTGRLLTMETASEQGAESGKYVCNSGDAVYSKIRPALAKAVIAPEHCLCSADMYPLRGNSSLNNKFIFWTLLSKWFTAWSILESDRVAMPKINRETLGGCLLCAPPLPEQHAIATFLDAQTAKIDTLIAKKRELIDKLKEKRAALITRTVTRGLPQEAAKAAGLDPNPRMKDSGVEWLGEVPEHWEMKRLKHITTLQSGITLGKDRQHKSTVSVPYLRVANVQDGYIDTTDVAEIEIEPHEIEKYVLYKGDILMNEGGDNDKLGRGGVWSGEINPCIHQNHVFCLRPYNVEPEYVSLYMQSLCAKAYFFLSAKQSTNLASISSRSVIELHVPLPPAHERAIILSYVSGGTSRIDNALDATERTIAKLQEYRSALITAAVTGKIDVRDGNKGVAG